ncbi:MAG TPA: class I SAM-dependent methyltransferase [Nitrospira sp.]|nr:class I SAM-dependent methyltransferase [Nitrospira sp.]
MVSKLTDRHELKRFDCIWTGFNIRTRKCYDDVVMEDRFAMATDAGGKGTEAGYDCWAATYDDGDPSTWLDEPFLLDQLKPFPGCRILDLGCGTGRYLRRLASGLYRITAVDLSRGMLCRARRDIERREEISWVQTSVTCLPFQSRLFDRVMSGLVLDHIERPEHLFGQIAAVLKQKGRAVVTAVHPDMQRLTGADIELASLNGSVRISGHLHEVRSLIVAAQDATLMVECIEEPVVTEAMVSRRSDWRHKLGCPALLLLALSK